MANPNEPAATSSEAAPPLPYEPLPLIVYRPRWRKLLPLTAFFAVGGIPFVVFGAMAIAARQGMIFGGGFVLLGLVAMVAGVGTTVWLRTVRAGINRNGITCREGWRTRHIPFTNIRQCKLDEDAEAPVQVVLKDWSTIAVPGLEHCLRTERAAFVEAVNRELARNG